MVCHESYKDKDNNWLYPDEVEKIDGGNVVKKSDNSKVIVSPPESMSKSKKNTIDPEKMINQYGADAVRWFILSDSPPEKDVQWSDTGVISANKFLQKIWNLNYLILKKNAKDEKDVNVEKKFNLEINSFVKKIDDSIDLFRFNVSIANFYEMFNIFKDNLNKPISAKVFKSNLIKLMKLMIPFTPHLAYECLEMLNCKDVENWPEIDKKNLVSEIKFAVQVNGKTRDILNVEKNLNEEDINKIIIKKSKSI